MDVELKRWVCGECGCNGGCVGNVDGECGSVGVKTLGVWGMWMVSEGGETLGGCGMWMVKHSVCRG